MTDRTVRVRLEAITSAYQAKLAQAAAATKSFEKSVTDMSSRHRQGLDMLGVGMIGFGTAVVGGLGVAGKAAMDFESSFAGVRKTVDASEGQFAQMASELRELGPALGVNVNELNAIAEEAGQLGIQRGSIVKFTETIAKLRETTDLVDAAPLARLMNIMQTAPGEIDGLASALVALGNDGASTEAEILDMSQRIAGAGNIIGFTEANVLSYANAIASAGIRSEAGGSSISRVMLDIGEAVQTGGDKLGVFADVAGMSATEFQAAFEKDAAGAIATFIAGLGRINESGGNVVGTLRELGFSERRVTTTLLGLAGSGDLLTDSLTLGNKATEDANEHNEEFAKRMDTNRKKVDQAKAQLNDLAITIGGAVLPVIGKLAEIGTAAFGGLADAINILPGPVQAVATGLGGMVGVVSVLGGGFLLLAPRIVAAKDAWVALNMAQNLSKLSAGGFIRSLGLIGVAFVALPPLIDAVTRGVQDFIDTMESKGLVAALTDLERMSQGGIFDPKVNPQTREGWNQFLGEIAEGADNAAGAFQRSIGPSKSFAEAVRGTPNLFDSVSESARGVGSSITDTGEKMRRFAGMTGKEFDDWRAGTRGAINSVDDLLGKLADKANLTSDQIIRAFTRQTRQMAEYEDNWRKLLRRGLPDSLTQQLQEMGIEGAGIVEQLANANDKEFGKIVREWLRAQGISKRTADAIAGDFGKIGGKVKGVANEVAGLGTQLHNLPGSVDIDVKATGTQIGDGPGRVSGGTAVSWANSAIGAVAGPQYITSTYRSPAHNAAVGGSPTSYHMDASNPAADIGGTNLAAIYSYLTRFPVRELINEGDHIHVADQGGTFRGPGLVRMGAGFETFAAGLQPAQKVRDIVSPVPVMRQVVREESSPTPVMVEVRPRRGAPDFTDFVDVIVNGTIDDRVRRAQRWEN